jgi:hypothetical protein
MKNIITINGAKFARNDSAFAETLFDSNGTACGLYKVRKRGIEFLKPCGELFAFLVANKYGERFFVSAHKVDGKKRYMYSTSSEAEKLLNLSELGSFAKTELAREVWESVTA